ncbi:VanZ family protein [Paenibacillus macerans]|uniref:VanZ family protein n=1 Tax=Paenibacillus macerans TaxID=44252 RepID=UPI003D31ED40
MIETYLFPITYAFGAFPFAALFFTMPFLVVQYRRHGYVNKVRALVLYLFLLYLMNAVFLVMLPLPHSRHNPPLGDGALQLIPFNFIQDILKETSIVQGEPSTYWRLLKERAFLQVAFNVVLTIPFGMLLRYYFRTGPVRSLILSFLLSLFFEVTQLTGIYGLYDNPYRVFDIDDLMTNTLGGMIGFLIALWLSRFMPRIEQLDQGVDLATKRVTYTRRGLALFFDSIVWAALMTIIYRLGVPGAYFVSTGLYFMLLAYVTGGRTLGKWLVRIQLTGIPADESGLKARGSLAAGGHRLLSRSEGERIGLVSLVIRYGLLYWLVFGLNRLLAFPPDAMPSLLRVFLGLSVMAMNLWFFIHVAKRFFQKEPMLFYEKISRTRHVITLKQTARAESKRGRH